MKQLIPLILTILLGSCATVPHSPLHTDDIYYHPNRVDSLQQAGIHTTSGRPAGTHSAGTSGAHTDPLYSDSEEMTSGSSRPKDSLRITSGKMTGGSHKTDSGSSLELIYSAGDSAGKARYESEIPEKTKPGTIHDKQANLKEGPQPENGASAARKLSPGADLYWIYPREMGYPPGGSYPHPGYIHYLYYADGYRYHPDAVRDAYSMHYTSRIFRFHRTFRDLNYFYPLYASAGLYLEKFPFMIAVFALPVDFAPTYPEDMEKAATADEGFGLMRYYNPCTTTTEIKRAVRRRHGPQSSGPVRIY